MQHTQSRLAMIAKRDYTTQEFDESDEEGSPNDSYDIDASGHMFQAINFKIGQGKPNNGASASAAPKDDPPRRRPKKNSKSSKKGHQSDEDEDLLNSMPVASAKHLPALGAIERKPVEDPLNKSVKDNRTLLSRLEGPVPNISEEELAMQRTIQFRQEQEEAMAKEKEEMRKMMEDIKREKMELEKLNAKKEKEKSQEAEMALREREELRIALESMRLQNETLMDQMKQTSEEAKIEIENEKRQRALQVSEIEKQNKILTQQVLDQQAEAERKLAAERDELKSALKRMESEKLALSTKIYETEMASKKEADELERQRLEFANKLKEMENEKFNLQRLMQENEKQAQNASELLAGQLAKEKEDLERKLAEMDSEKNGLSEALVAKEEAASNHAKELSSRLEEEKKALLESTARMEEEKMALANALSSAESEAKRQASIVSEQLAKEKKILEETKQQMRREQEAMEQRLRANEEGAKKSNEEMTEEMRREKQALEAHLAAVKREKEEMEEKYRQSTEENIRREKEAAARLAKERDELREAVERMKSEMELEKKRNEQALAAKEDQKSNGLKSKSGVNLASSNKSLYNILEEGEEDGERKRATSGRRSHRSSRQHMTGSKRSLKHLPIKERNESSSEAQPTADNEEEDFDEFVDDVCDDEYDSEGEDEVEDEFDQLPAPHAAAARGDLEHFQRLGKLDASLLSSVDSSGRSPLFYAMAYNNEDVVGYILEKSPSCALQTDVHGDTPLHAGCSSDSLDSVQILIASLKKMGEDVNVANSMGMTPMHLAASGEIMSALYSANADLKVVDNNNRSPLFVAAAMNRTSCVEFLLDCLGGDDEALYMIDARGDTPLHAAACNGSSESLLLLLQCGITPLMTNNKGLKAIDLAQKNKQKKCREILAQYHLHFATTSDFDSVLFIATLEGQKKIQETLKTSLNGAENTETYNIIKKQYPNGERDSSSDSQMKDKVKNLFSLNSSKSLRLKRYGSWIAYEDQSCGSDNIYWYNHSTGTGQWEVPESVVPLVGKSGTLKSKGSSKQMLRISSKSSMRLKRVGDWIQYSTEAGQTFYYNDKNGDFQWMNPKGDEVNQDMMEQAKEEEWVAYKDPDSGCVFWYNQKTHVSQWECPLEPGSDGYLDPKGGQEVDVENYAADLVEVHDNDDLGI